MQNETIKDMVENIAKIVRETGECVQYFGPCNEDMETDKVEAHVQLEEELKTLGIETIEIYAYANIYLPYEIEKSKRQAHIEEYKKLLPIAYNSIVRNYARVYEGIVVTANSFESLMKELLQAL